MFLTLRALGNLEPWSHRKRMILDNADLPSSIQEFLHFASLPLVARWAILGDEYQNLEFQWLVRWAWYRFGIFDRSGLNRYRFSSSCDLSSKVARWHVALSWIGLGARPKEPTKQAKTNHGKHSFFSVAEVHPSRNLPLSQDTRFGTGVGVERSDTPTIDVH